MTNCPVFSVDTCIFHVYLGRCGTFVSGKGYQYVCNGTEINRVHYNSADCIGDPLSTKTNICAMYPDGDCTAICDKMDCDTVVVEMIYGSSNDCTGDISIKNYYIPGYCATAAFFSSQVIYSDGKIQFNTYFVSDECSGDPNLSEIYDTTTCVANSTQTSYKHDICDSECDSCARFSLSVVVSITVFIASSFGCF